MWGKDYLQVWCDALPPNPTGQLVHIPECRFLLVFHLKKFACKHLSLECRKVKIWGFRSNVIMIHWRTSTDHGGVWTKPSVSSTHWTGPCSSFLFAWRVLTWCSWTPRGPPVGLGDPQLSEKASSFMCLCLCAFFWGETSELCLDLQRICDPPKSQLWYGLRRWVGSTKVDA